MVEGLLRRLVLLVPAGGFRAEPAGVFLTPAVPLLLLLLLLLAPTLLLPATDRLLMPRRCSPDSLARRCSSCASRRCRSSASRVWRSRSRSWARRRSASSWRSRSCCISSSRVAPCHPLLNSSRCVCSVCDRIRTHLSSSLSAFCAPINTF